MMIIIMIFMLRETLTILLKLQTKYVLCFSVSLQLNLSHSPAIASGFFCCCCCCFAFYAACASIVHVQHISLMSFYAVAWDVSRTQYLVRSFYQAFLSFIFCSMLSFCLQFRRFCSPLRSVPFCFMRSNVLTNSIYVSVT